MRLLALFIVVYTAALVAFLWLGAWLWDRHDRRPYRAPRHFHVSIPRLGRRR